MEFIALGLALAQPWLLSHLQSEVVNGRCLSVSLPLPSYLPPSLFQIIINTLCLKKNCQLRFQATFMPETFVKCPYMVATVLGCSNKTGTHGTHILSAFKVPGNSNAYYIFKGIHIVSRPFHPPHRRRMEYLVFICV